MSIEEAQERVARAVIGLDGVAGTAIGLSRGKPCITIMIVRDDPALRAKLPSAEAGFPVRIEASGQFRAAQGRANVP